MGDDLRPRDRQGVERHLLQLRPPLLRPLRAPRADLDASRSTTTTPTRPRARSRNINFVDPPFPDGGAGDGISGDEHPHGDIRIGQAFMSDVVHAFMDSPQFERGALFIVYDEWGGFFDHVPPRVRPRRPRQQPTSFENCRLHRASASRRVVVSPFVRARQRQPRDDHVRVDPEADLLQVQPRLPEQAPPLRLQHRPHLRLAQARTSSRRTCPTRRPIAASAVHARRGSARPRPRRAEAARSDRARDLAATSTGSATSTCPRPTIASSATPTGSSGPWRRTESLPSSTRCRQRA